MLLRLKFHKRQSLGVSFPDYHSSGLVGAIPLENVCFYMDKVMILLQKDCETLLLRLKHLMRFK